VDFEMMHEATCHNREKNGTTDFSQTVTARQTHACDLLTGAAGQHERSHELDFYGGLRPHECATNFLASAGIPIFEDPFEEVGRLAQHVRVTRRLNKKSRQPESERSKATRVMRLMEKGEVDGEHWEQVCKQLSRNLKAEAMQSFLGQLASSSLNLSTMTDFAGAKNGGGKDDRVTSEQEVQTPECTGVTNAQHGSLLSFSGLDSINTPSVRGKQPVVSPRPSIGLRRPDCKTTSDTRRCGCERRAL